VREQQCSTCGAVTGPDGTSTCDCVLTAAQEVDAVFEAAGKQSASSTAVLPTGGEGTQGAAAPGLGDPERRGARRRKGVIVAAAAVALSLAGAAFFVGLTVGDVSGGEAALNPSGVGPSSSAVETDEPGQPSASDSPSGAETSAPGRDGAKPSKGSGKGKGDGKGGKDPKPPSDDDDRQLGVPVLVEGDTGPEVAELQRKLKVQPADGVFDNRLTHAVVEFQDENGIEGDAPGVYGPNTRRALDL
jgi:hypothetical protein